MYSSKLFTIITVCYNAEKTIGKTIESVINQNNNNYEYIIVDGGSKDSTVSIIKEHIKDRNWIKYVSEPDNGIYDAMNKGLLMSSGEWIIFINADDWLEDNILNYIEDYINDNPYRIEAIYGNIKKRKENGELIGLGKPSKDINNIVKKGMPLYHQAIFIKRKVYDELKGFNINYKIAGDWDFILRMIKNNIPLVYLDVVFSNFSIGGVSEQSHILEKHRIRKNNNIVLLFDRYMFIEVLVYIKNKLKKFFS